jgi:hypothetical protein
VRVAFFLPPKALEHHTSLRSQLLVFMLQRRLFEYSPSAYRVFERIRRRLRPLYESDVQKHLRERQEAGYLLLSLTNCGRTWLRVILGRAMQQHYSRDYAASLADMNLHDLYSFSERIPTLPAIKPMHEKYKQFGHSYEGKKVILLVRDPRDAIVSRYHQHREELAQKLGYDDLDRYLCESDELAGYIQFYNDWQNHPDSAKDVLTVRYEDMKADTLASVQRVCEFLQLPITPTEMSEAIDYASFKNMRKMEIEGSTQVRTGVMSTRNVEQAESFKVRKGAIGGYRNELKPESVSLIDRAIATQLNPIYGYR